MEGSEVCFCYPCKVYQSHQKEKTCTITGYNNLKMALVKGRGFKKHETSEQHLTAMRQWKEMKQRDLSNTTRSAFLSTPNPEHHTWLFTIFSVVKFLVMSSIPLRDDTERTDFEEWFSRGYSWTH